ncbi:MAG: YihY/virulence factor BrkB family protein [Thermoflexibacter sp.]|jgi:membrane protein|nr:YihY/virulence factor BrkB family protein [Thermoflexibacter sp.]
MPIKPFEFIKKKILPFMKDLIKAFLHDDCLNMSAALAYYTTFSLAPMLIILVALAGFFLEKQAVRAYIYNYVAEITTDLRAADLIQSLLDNISFSSHGITLTIVSAITVLVGATTVFGVLHNSLNKIWEVSENKRKGFWNLVIQRLISLLTIFLIGILLVTTLIINAIVNFLYDTIIQFVELPKIVISLFNSFIPIFILFLFFVLIFKLLSDAKLRWKLVFIGAALTTILLIIGRLLISFYLSSTAIGSVYGTAASLATLLIWVYYSSLMVFVGAEFIKVYARHTGNPLENDDGI